MNRRNFLKGIGAATAISSLPLSADAEKARGLEKEIERFMPEIVASLTRDDEGNRGYDYHEVEKITIKKTPGGQEINAIRGLERYTRIFDFEDGWIGIKYEILTNKEGDNIGDKFILESAVKSKKVVGEFEGWRVEDHWANGLRQGCRDSVDSLKWQKCSTNQCSEKEKNLQIKKIKTYHMDESPLVLVQEFNKDYLSKLETLYSVLQRSPGKGEEKGEIALIR